MRNMLTTRDLFNDMFDWPTFHDFDSQLMRTDIKEENGKYLLAIDMPGFDKNDIEISLENGYLNVEAKHNDEKEEKDDEGNYIMKERRYGSCSRSYYVGDNIKEEDISASYTNGTLNLSVTKNKEEQIENKHYIPIEDIH